MNPLKALRAILKKESATAEAILNLSAPDQAIWSGVDYKTLAKEGYTQNPYVYACVEYISRALAGVPWKLKNSVGQEHEDTLNKHPLLDLIQRPNPWQGRTAFFKELTGFFLLSGNAFIERVGPNNLRQPPKELYCLRPDRMFVVPGTPQSRIGGYEYICNGMTTRFEQEQILHLKCFHPLDDWYGFAPTQAGARSIDQSNASKAWNVSLLQNAARPSGALVTDAALADPIFKRLKRMIDEDFTGTGKAGKPLLLESGLKWVEMGLTPAEMGWISGQKLSAREIAIVFCVPPELIGDSENKTYSNWQEARKAFYHETILPLLDFMRDELNNWLVPLFGGGLYLDYESEEVEALQEDRTAVWQRAAAAYSAQVVTRNEARQLMGLPPDLSPESDDFKSSPVPIATSNDESGDIADPESKVPDSKDNGATVPVSQAGADGPSVTKKSAKTPREQKFARVIKHVLTEVRHDVQNRMRE